MPVDANPVHDLKILEHIETNPDTTQADIATQLGVAVGTANWYVKRLLTKGYIKVTHLQRRRLRYLITPKGIAEKSRLTLQYMRISLQLYRRIREQSLALIKTAERAGHSEVIIEGDGDVAEICRLTCLEQHVDVVGRRQAASGAPTFVVDGLQVRMGE